MKTRWSSTLSPRTARTSGSLSAGTGVTASGKKMPYRSVHSSGGRSVMPIPTMRSALGLNSEKRICASATTTPSPMLRMIASSTCTRSYSSASSLLAFCDCSVVAVTLRSTTAPPMHRPAASSRGYPLAFSQRSSFPVVALRFRNRTSASPVGLPRIAAVSGRSSGGNCVRPSAW